MRTTGIADIVIAITKLDVEKIAEFAKDVEELNWTDPDNGNNLLFVSLKNFGGRISDIPLNEKTNEEQIAELEEFVKKGTAIISIFLENGVDANCEDIIRLHAFGMCKIFICIWECFLFCQSR